MSAPEAHGPFSPRPQARLDLVCVVLDDELVVFDEQRRTLHHLNSSARLVWDRCDGLRTVDEIVRSIALECSLVPDDVSRDVTELLERLRAAALLVEPDEPRVPASDADGSAAR